MAGLIFKITIEDTHPPVWRRIIFPELASFQDLHDVIQTAFGWDDDHLHIFSTQELEIVGEDVDAYKDFVMEDIASVGEIFHYVKSMRYIYDFGDEWKHKIVFEKTMENYNEDFATVLKAKGENFEEDTGGIWYDVHQTQAYNIDTVNAKLAGMHFTKVSMAERDWKMVKHIFEMKENYNKFRQLFRQQAEDLLKKLDKQAEEKQKSVMHNMMDEWSSFCKGQDKAFVCRRAPQKTSREMFMCLTEKEASDYAKYLKISEDELAGREVRNVVAETLRLHPEYYLYVLDKHDITQLQKFQKFEENKKGV